MAKSYRVHLIACSPEQSPMAYPLGALCIQTALATDRRLTQRVSVELSHYIADKMDPELAAQETAQKDIDLLGISLYLYNREWFRAYVFALRKLKPALHIFAGGPETMADSSLLFDWGISTLILGEGEETVCDLVCQLIEGEQISGRGICTNAHEPKIPRYPSDLASLASPLLTAIAKPRDYEGVLWEMTRGCPYHCAFCFESRGNRSVRTYPAKRLQAELELLIENEVEHVFVLDPTFNMRRDRTVQMLTMIRDLAPPEMHFTFEVRAELLDEATAQLFGQFHCSLQIGLQSSSRAVLKSIGRDFNADLFAQKIALLNTHGVVFGLDLIIGLPGDTLETFEESLDFAVSCKPSNLDIFLLALLPGTQLALDAESLGLEHASDSPYLLSRSPSMDAEAIDQALQLKDACDLFYTTGRAVMWLHAACSALELTPSQWFSRFSAFTRRHRDLEHEDIFTLQDVFVREQFIQQRKESLLPAMLSYMELHQGIAHFQDTADTPVIQLFYPADTLALLDSMDLATFIAQQTPFEEPVEHLVFEQEGMLFVEPLIN